MIIIVIIVKTARQVGQEVDLRVANVFSYFFRIVVCRPRIFFWLFLQNTGPSIFPRSPSISFLDFARCL